MKIAAILLAFTLAGGAALPARAPAPLVQHEATLLLAFADGTCSGVAVGPHLIATAEHCVVEGPLVKVQGHGCTALEWTPAKIVGKPLLDGADHALVTVDMEFLCQAQLGGKLYQGQEIHFWGNPLGLSDLLRRGYVSGTEQGWFLLDVMGGRGDSGSGIFDRSGRIVGVVSTLYVQDEFHMLGAKPLAFTRAQYASVGL